MTAPTTLVWLRNDLRLQDHPALFHAAERGTACPVFVWAPGEAGGWPPGGAQRWWLHHSLDALQAQLADRGAPLILRQGASLAVLRALIRETNADAVYWNARFTPALRQRDEDVAAALKEDGIEVATFAGRLLHDPDEIRTQGGTPYKVFTPFWRKLKDRLRVAAPLPAPSFQEASSAPRSDALASFGLLPAVDWAGGIRAAWTPGEAGAHERLDAFLTTILSHYEAGRDRPDGDGTSRLSPHLHHGEISPRQVWQGVQAWAEQSGEDEAAEGYLRQIAWREFSYHLLYHFPHTPTEALKEKYAPFPWNDDPALLERWQHGRTGYPIVDAGMRQLWETGWMHNRVRMIVASFLTKDLLLPWQEGARWFWDTLVDADLANNTMGWQWAAGSGADAQPFFRIFNPVAQGRRHDPDGRYVRRWVPELAGLPDRYLHAPWTAPDKVCAAAGLTLGADYPTPAVDHQAARQSALDAYQTIR